MTNRDHKEYEIIRVILLWTDAAIKHI